MTEEQRTDAENPQDGGGQTSPQQGTQITDVTELQRQLNAVRQEAANYRTQLRAAEDRLGGQSSQQPGQQQAAPTNGDQLAANNEAATVAQAVAQAVAAALQPLNQQITALQEQVSGAEQTRLEVVRRSVQNSLGLTDELMRRVQGGTEAEIRQDAERLLNELRGLPQRGVMLNLGAGSGDGAGGASSYAEQIFKQRQAQGEQKTHPLVRR